MPIFVVSVLFNERTMYPKFYKVLETAIEEGVAHGVMRTFKHSEESDIEDMKNAISMSVMDSLNEWFQFDDDEEDEDLWSA